MSSLPGYQAFKFCNPAAQVVYSPKELHGNGNEQNPKEASQDPHEKVFDMLHGRLLRLDDAPVISQQVCQDLARTAKLANDALRFLN